MTISIIFTTCSKTKNTIFWSDSVKKKSQQTIRNLQQRMIKFSNNQWISSQQVYDTYSMQDLYFDKKNFRQRYKDTVNPKNKISSQTSVLSI